METDEIIRALRNEDLTCPECKIKAQCAGEPKCLWNKRAADLIESLQKQLIDYYHMGKVVDGQQNQNARLRKIVDKLTARAEKAEAERDTYRAALEALHISTDLLKGE